MSIIKYDRVILRADGSIEKLTRKYSFEELKKMCGFEYGELITNLGGDNSKTMIVDEDGLMTTKQVNIQASRYASECRGYELVIVGDVAIVPKGDIR